MAGRALEREEMVTTPVDHVRHPRRGARDAAWALAALHAALLPAHLATLPDGARLVMTAATAASVVVLAGIGLSLRRLDVGGPTFQALLAIVCAVPLVNSLAYLALTSDLRHTSTLMLVLVGIGALQSSRTGAFAVSLAGLVGWAVVVGVQGLRPADDVVHYAFGLGMALVLGSLVNELRGRIEQHLRDVAERVVVESQAARAASDELASTDLRFRHVFTGSPVGIAMADEGGFFMAANPAFCALLGRTESELLGHSPAEFTHPEDQALSSYARRMIEDSEDGVARVEKRYVRPDGSLRWAWLTITDTPGTAGQVWTVAHVEDVTERKAAEQELRDSEANLAAVAQVVRRMQNEDAVRDIVGRALRELAGADSASLIERDGDDLIITQAQGRDVIGARFPARATSASAQVMRTGKPLYLADASMSPLVSAAMLALTGGVSMLWQPVVHRGTIVAVLNVAWNERQEQLSPRVAHVVELLAIETGVALAQDALRAELRASARTDVTTGLPNRRAWDEALLQQMTSARRHGSPLCVAVADLDRFKDYNDSWGHQAGDSLLQGFAVMARTALRDVDVLARWGGEEFTLALPGCSMDDASLVLERLRATVPAAQTCSVGVVQWDGHESAARVLARADAAMYAAKAGGRDRLVSA